MSIHMNVRKDEPVEYGAHKAVLKGLETKDTTFGERLLWLFYVPEEGAEVVRYPSAEEFLRWEGASSPLAGPIGALSEDAREALIRDLGQALRTYTDDDGIVFPAETHLAVAHR